MLNAQYNDRSTAMQSAPAGSWNVQAQGTPQEPCLQAKADELLKFISELENHMGTIDGSLTGSGKDEVSAKSLPPSSLEGKIASACSRAASLCGYAATIVRQIG